MEYAEGAIPLRYYVQIFKAPSNPEVFSKEKGFHFFYGDFYSDPSSERIYHGDLKSDNFLIKEKGEKEWECLIVDTDRVYFGKGVSLSHRIKTSLNSMPRLSNAYLLLIELNFQRLQ